MESDTLATVYWISAAALSGSLCGYIAKRKRLGDVGMWAAFGVILPVIGLLAVLLEEAKPAGEAKPDPIEHQIWQTAKANAEAEARERHPPRTPLPRRRIALAVTVVIVALSAFALWPQSFAGHWASVEPDSDIGLNLTLTDRGGAIAGHGLLYGTDSGGSALRVSGTAAGEHATLLLTLADGGVLLFEAQRQGRRALGGRLRSDDQSVAVRLLRQ